MARPLPRHLAVALHATAALLWFGAFSFYVRVWLQPRDATGELLRWASSTVDGTNSAPYQYRVLVPHLQVGLHDHLGWSGATAQGAIDAAALGIGIVAIAALLRRLHLEVWVLAVAAYGCALSIGLLWWGKAESITAFAATSVAVWAIGEDGRRRWWALAPAALVLAGTRTDLLLALGVALLARWAWAGRRRGDLVAGLALGALGALATVVLKAAYPDATYPVAVVQVAHNLQPVVLLTLIAFVAPALAPWLLADREPSVRRAFEVHRATIVPALALVAAEVASLLVVGRAEEVRLLFPLTGALGVLGVLGWRAALGPYASSGAAVEASAERDTTPVDA
ncbi:MAG: hypothetical protein R2702_12710 [Acidimicrobiales bacterium]